ncbi:MFS general substrate transporter [Mytilinidion resinicola]|uniref:MFS general substrate transporter n=1 Tax=Mytilinidion resinicola TaxID=574789 RepID=A0A6A6Y0W3_9PEZI|nr:MFS general substrate transporter [Mytilinidion resinicola]KAF2802402.1 MFS general substrate transporter [Mytilinidion resinicola]
MSKDISQHDDAADAPDVEKQPVPETEGVGDTSREKDPNIVDWDGPDDPANPMNWSSAKKLAAIGIVSIISFTYVTNGPFASTVISPASADVMKTFHSTNETLGAFVTTVYLLGYVFGPLVIAPLSELYGRAILYNICNFIFLIFNIACALANNLGALIVFRLLAGIAASCAITLGPGTVADMTPVEKRGLAMVGLYMGPLVGPTFAPLAASYLAEAKGWRWIFWLISILAGVVWVAAMLFIHESYAYVILKWKTKRLRKETGNQQLRSALHTGNTPGELFKISIVRPLKMLFLSPIVFLMSLYMAIVYGYLYLLFTTYPRVFQGQYGFSNGTVGLAYLGSGIGTFIGLVFCGATLDRLLVYLTKRNGGIAKPEYRLPVMAIGALFIPLALFMYGWTAEKKEHWILPIIGTGFLGIGMFTIFMPCATYLVDAFTLYAASVTAASTVLRSLLGALLPLAGGKMYDALGVGWGTSLLGFIAVAFIPMPFILWTFGERIRESRFSQVKF